MGGLGTVVILLTLGVLGDDAPPAEETAPARTEAPNSNPNPSPSPAPVPPIQYLKAGIMFFNTGKYEQSGKYIEAAQRFRDQLNPKEQIVLDVYRDALVSYEEELRLAASAPPANDPEVKQASKVTTEPPAKVSVKARPNPESPKEAARPGQLDKAIVGRQPAKSDDLKQEARWLLHEAREQIQRGNYDQAVQKVAQARSLNVKWGFLDDNPDKVDKAIVYYRKRRPSPAKEADGKASAELHDLRTAQDRLQEARDALAKNQVDHAEEIAREVKGWGLDFGKSNDSPDKLLATIRTVKLLETIHKYGGELPPEK
jgi:hypothetical protein